MGIARAHAMALVGLDARRVAVEATTGQGLPGTRLVGLPDTAVRESAERVKSAIARSGLRYPPEKVTVNLAPAALRKSGAGFDLPVALAILAAHDQLAPSVVDATWSHGELGLDGRTRAVPGSLPVAEAVRRAGGRRLLVADAAAVEAALVTGLDVVPVASLGEAVAVLRGEQAPRVPDAPSGHADETVPDLVDVRGQPLARRAVEVAAAGAHHLLLAGPPGCGKSMLAERLPGLLPRLGLAEALEVAAVHSVAGVRAPDAPLSRVPPYRAPHHTVSMAGLVGGGAGIARPGELSLAHGGVLFIDELLELPRPTLDALRQPLERGEVVITRSLAAVRYPAHVQLVAATNPCPCGHLSSPTRRCRCRPDEVVRYRNRLSGPLLDRIDLQVELRPVERDALVGPPDGEPSHAVAARVAAARAAAADRWGDGATNRGATISRVRATASLEVLTALSRAVDRLGLSARAFDRSLRVARTIADLDGRDAIGTAHVDEAVGYRLPEMEGVR
jgi:magnesium chelatase family protein